MPARIEVAGDELTPREMAAAIAAALDRPVIPVEVPLNEIQARSADLAAMYRFLASTGYEVDRSQLRRLFPDLHWRPFTTWASSQPW